MSHWLLAAAVAAGVTSPEPRSQPSLRDLDDVKRFEQALRAVDAIKRRKRLQCVMSIANGAVCTCLAEQLPVDTYIRSYAAVRDRDRTGPDYAQLSAADRAIVERCVAGDR